MLNESLRAELLSLAKDDQELRRRAPLVLGEKEAREWLEAEQARSARAAAIVDEHGWPGLALVGEDGAHAAWLLIQHSDHDVELQERCLTLLRAAVDRGDAPSVHLAYLTDRVCVHRGRDQLYGTQFSREGDAYGPHPISEPERLDARRTEVGLESFADYRERMEEINRSHP